MKLIRTASGNKLKISKKEWLAIGNKQGWIKKAQTPTDDDLNKWYDSLKGLAETNSKVNFTSQPTTHQERSPGSYEGTREVKDLEKRTYTYTAILSGDIHVLSQALQAKDPQQELGKMLEEDIKDCCRDNMIPVIKNYIDEIYRKAGDRTEENINIDIDIKSMVPKGGNIYNVTFALEYEVSFYDEHGVSMDDNDNGDHKHHLRKEK